MARPRLALLADLARDVRDSLRERGGAGTRPRRSTRRFTPGSSGGSIPPGDEAAADRRSAEELKRRLDETRERLKQENAPE
jgi:hypothetical protein